MDFWTCLPKLLSPHHLHFYLEYSNPGPGQMPEHIHAQVCVEYLLPDASGQHKEEQGTPKTGQTPTF